MVLESCYSRIRFRTEMPQVEPADHRLYATAAIGGGVLTLVGLLLPWISVGAGSGQFVYQGTQLFASWVPTVLLALLTVVFASLWWRLGNDDFSVYAALAAGFLTLLLIVTLFAVETANDLIPTSFLPAILRRSAGLLTAGPGLWISLAGAVVSLFATSGLASTQLAGNSWNTAANRRGMGAAAVLLGLMIFVGWLRCQPWVASSVLGQGLSLSGQATPWLGPASLFSLVLLGGALALAGLSRFQAAGLLAAGSGWLISFSAAIAVIASESVAQLRLGDLLDGTGHSVTFHTAAAAWGTYVSGLLIAVVGGFLVSWPHHSGGE